VVLQRAGVYENIVKEYTTILGTPSKYKTHHALENGWRRAEPKWQPVPPVQNAPMGEGGEVLGGWVEQQLVVPGLQVDGTEDPGTTELGKQLLVGRLGVPQGGEETVHHPKIDDSPGLLVRGVRHKCRAVVLRRRPVRIDVVLVQEVQRLGVEEGEVIGRKGVLQKEGPRWLRCSTIEIKVNGRIVNGGVVIHKDAVVVIEECGELRWAGGWWWWGRRRGDRERAQNANKMLHILGMRATMHTRSTRHRATIGKGRPAIHHSCMHTIGQWVHRGNTISAKNPPVTGHTRGAVQ
jgi:hypothetical protein